MCAKDKTLIHLLIILQCVQLCICLTFMKVVRKSDHKLFTVNTLRSESWEAIQTTRKDFEIGLMLKGCKHIAQVQEWIREGRIVLEHVIPVLQGDVPMPLGEFLRLAVNITEALAFVHERNIIHNAIHPRYFATIKCTDSYRCILYSPEEDCYKLTGFGWATIGSSDPALKIFEAKGGQTVLTHANKPRGSRLSVSRRNRSCQSQSRLSV